MRARIFISMITMMFVMVISTVFNPQHVQAADSRELLRLDCTGVLHLFKDTPFEIDLDLNFLKSVIETFRNRMRERVHTKCPSVTEEEINRRFVPSLDLALNLLFGAENRNTTTSCPDTFADSIYQLGTILNMFFSGTCDMELELADVTHFLPPTCSHESWASSKTCFLGAKFKEVIGDFELDLAATECASDMAWPFITLICQGSACINYLKPCSDVNSATQCGSNLKCFDLGPIANQGGDLESSITKAFAEAGLWHESMPTANVWNTVIKPIREFWASFFTNAQVGANKNDYLKFCFPDTTYQGKSYPNPFDMLDDALSIKETRNCTIRSECYGSGASMPSCIPNPYKEKDCKDGQYTEKNFNASALFKTNDDLPISCSPYGEKLWFQTNCSLTTVGSRDCPVEYRTVNGISTGKQIQCHTASNGLCGFHSIGDGWCDTACNITECVFDGGDCHGPAEVRMAPSDKYFCNLNNRQQIDSNSPCIDDPKKTQCINYLTRYEKGRGKNDCFYQTYKDGQYVETPTNQDCCVCNETTTFTQQSVYNLFSKFKEVSFLCNTAHAWDGMVGSESILERRDDTTFFPIESFQQGESQLVSFDCNGYVMLSLVSPLVRAKATGPLAAIKTIEKVVINVAQLRQDSDPGGTFVTADKKFTKLGYQNFGIFTPAYVLWQFTSAIRDDPRGADFLKYEKTTPGTKLMRESNPPANSHPNVEVVNIPSSCSFTKYITDKTCLLQYEQPILKKIGTDIKLRLGIASCPNTHIPEIVGSISGAWFDPFPFMTPCLSDANCPASHECIDLFQHIKNIAFTETGHSFSQIEYDLLTFFLFGKNGRIPNWGARTYAWNTEDVVYILKHLFGVLKFPNPFATTPAYAFGEVKLCFPDNDPFLAPLIKTGEPYDWNTASQGVNLTDVTYVNTTGYTVPLKVITLNGLQASSTPPIGIGVDNTLPPTKSPSGPPTKFDDSGNGASTIFQSVHQYMVASMVLILSLLFSAL